MTLYRRFGKRAIDCLVGGAALVVLAPLLIAVGLIVRIRLGSPVLFSQVRPGRDGRPFRMWKFRSMTEDRDARGELLPDARRLTPFGHWLRQTSLDELPELWNVLVGEMSLVGPRPLLLEYLPRYDDVQRRRHDVRPGITGLAQVRGRNAVPWEQRFTYDVEYVDRYGLALDAWIVWKTVGKVWRREGIEMEGQATMRPFVPTARDGTWPVFDEEQVAAVERVLRSGKVNYWTGGEGRQFEEEYAAALGVRHAIAVANGTAALELALMALGIGPGDEVVVPSRTFIATASAVVARGARPVVADIDRDSQNLTAETVEAVLTPRTRAIMAVHVGGWPCDMDPLLDLAERRGMFVVEDCAQAHGATSRGRPVGSMGHINAFSFCQDKILTTGGEGGLVTTDDTALWERAWSYKDHGKNRLATLDGPKTGTFRFLHDSFGTNWRLTEMQAAIGRIQLQRLPAWVARRRANAMRIVAGLADVPGIRFPLPGEDAEHSFYRLYGFIDPDALSPGWTRDRVLQELNSRGVPAGCGSCGEIYREKAFTGIGPVAPLPVARLLHETSLAFLVHPTLGDAAIDRTVDAVRSVLGLAMNSPSSGRARAA